MAKNNGNDSENLKEIVDDIESLGVLDRTDFENMEIMREDETFATMVEEHISAEEMDELSRAFKDLEDQIAAPAVAEDFASIELGEGEFGDMSEEDLDAMLKSLMDNEEDSDEDWVPIENIDAQLEQEPEIYEGENADKEIDLSVLEPDKKPKRANKSPRKWMAQQYRSGDKGSKVLVLSIAALSVLAVASLLFVAGMLIFVNMNDGEQGTFNVSPPPYAFNNASHSLVNLSAPLGDDTIFLSRLLLDEIATVFYFGGALDPERYIFALEDNNGRIYARNLVLSNTSRDQGISQTVVRFEAMDPTTEGFTISITDLHTNQTSEIELTFDSDAIAPGRYITSSITVDTGLSNIDINIDHGSFSAAASSLNFSIVHADPRFSLVFSEDTFMPPVSLRHMGATVPAMGALQLTNFPQDNIMLAAVDFNPLRTLTGRVEVVFGQIYKRYEMGITMSTDGMFSRNADRARTIHLANHTIHMHGLMQQGDFFVMPLYGVTGVGASESDTRVPTTMVVHLTGTIHYPQTRHISIPGTVQYDGRGTDVTFDITGNEAILEIPRNSLYLAFDSISVLLPEFSVAIDLDELGFVPSEDINAVKSTIESAITPNDIAQGTEYASQVRQVHFVGNTAYARVVERFAAAHEGSLQEVVRHHSVRAVMTAGGALDAFESVIESIEQRP